MRTDLATAAFSVAGFAFLATMAWTGKLAGTDSTKVRFFAWVVEDLVVGSFGRVFCWTGIDVGSVGPVDTETTVFLFKTKGDDLRHAVGQVDGWATVQYGS